MSARAAIYAAPTGTTSHDRPLDEAGIAALLDGNEKLIDTNSVVG